MGRYTGPKEKLERREGVDLGLKGRRALDRKTSLERRGPQPPGQHGAARRRQPSIYARQLRETQKLKVAYGVRERQFRRYINRAHRRREAIAGEVLLELLERRLDNVVYRLGFASTRAQARQFVTHGHVLVNGMRCDIPSREVSEGDVVSIKAGAPVEPLVREAIEDLGTVPSWLEVDVDGLAGRILRAPVRRDIATPVTEQLVIERYAR